MQWNPPNENLIATREGICTCIWKVRHGKGNEEIVRTNYNLRDIDSKVVDALYSLRRLFLPHSTLVEPIDVDDTGLIQ